MQEPFAFLTVYDKAASNKVKLGKKDKKVKKKNKAPLKVSEGQVSKEHRCFFQQEDWSSL